MPYGVLRRIDRNLLSVDIDAASLLGIRSEQRPGGFGSARAHQSGEAKNLALPQLKAHILHHLPCIQVFHLQHNRRVFRNHTVCLRFFIDYAADHHVDDVFLCAVICDQRPDVRTVTHDRDPVRYDLDLIHPVRNVDDAEILLSQIAYDRKEIFNLLFRKRGRRFIKDNHLRLVGNRLCDLAHLLFPDSQVTHPGSGIDIDVKFIEQFLRFLDHFPVIDHESLLEFTSDENVLRHGEVAYHIEFLMDDDDSRLLRVMRIVEFDFLSLEDDRSGILRIDAGQNLHESGFPGSVLAHQRMYLSALQRKIDMIQRVDTGEGFVDQFHLQDHFTHFLPPLCQLLRRLAETSAYTNTMTMRPVMIICTSFVIRIAMIPS